MSQAYRATIHVFDCFKHTNEKLLGQCHAIDVYFVYVQFTLNFSSFPAFNLHDLE